jgi:hypothetical protein
MSQSPMSNHGIFSPDTARSPAAHSHPRTRLEIALQSVSRIPALPERDSTADVQRRRPDQQLRGNIQPDGHFIRISGVLCAETVHPGLK